MYEQRIAEAKVDSANRVITSKEDTITLLNNQINVKSDNILHLQNTIIELQKEEEDTSKSIVRQGRKLIDGLANGIKISKQTNSISANVLTLANEQAYSLTPMNIKLGYSFTVDRSYFDTNCPFYHVKHDTSIYFSLKELHKMDPKTLDFLRGANIGIMFLNDSMLRNGNMTTKKNYLELPLQSDTYNNFELIGSGHIDITGKNADIYIEKLFKDVDILNLNFTGINTVNELKGRYMICNIDIPGAKTIKNVQAIVYTSSKQRFHVNFQNGKRFECLTDENFTPQFEGF